MVHDCMVYTERAETAALRCVSKISGGSVYICIYAYIDFTSVFANKSENLERVCIEDFWRECIFISIHVYMPIYISPRSLQTNRRIRIRRVSKISGGSAYRYLYIYISYRWRGTERHCGLVPVSALRQVVEKPCTVL